MKICAAQTRPIIGNVQGNIHNHKALINLAVSRGAELVIFPELSLTGYEPRLANELATNPNDGRFEVFQELSDSKKLTIGVGMPTRHDAGVCISMILFQPHKGRRVYSKSYLHSDEIPFFVAGQSSPDLKINELNLALAVCYEISVAEHLEAALKYRPEIYFASVAKFVRGIDKALVRLSEIAKQHSMMVLMSNSIGSADGSQCAGKTSVWNRKGELLGQLDGTAEGLLIFDTKTQKHEQSLVK